jgi:hypothetical protein
MRNHTKVYLKYFGYSGEDFIPCEVCGKKAVDIHHIEARGMGGTNKADAIENLMGLCREHHLQYGDKKQYMEFLKDLHKQKLQ